MLHGSLGDVLIRDDMKEVGCYYFEEEGRHDIGDQHDPFRNRWTHQIQSGLE